MAETNSKIMDSLIEEIYTKIITVCTSPKDAVVVLLAVHVKIATGNIEVPLDIMLNKYCDAFRELYQKN